MLEIVFSDKFVSRFLPFYPKTFKSRKAILILVIAEVNCMAQIKEKTGIPKSVVIATVVAIRAVLKNGFHCIIVSRTRTKFTMSQALRAEFIKKFLSHQRRQNSH